MHLSRHAEVSLDSPIVKLNLEKFAVHVVGNCDQSCRVHGGGFHDCVLNLDICGLPLRLRSPSAAAISFQRAIISSSPTAGAIASITR